MSDSATAIATLQSYVGFDPAARRRFFTKAIKAAGDPGVREFFRLIHAARLLHKRANKWLRDHDTQDGNETATMKNLTLATDEDDDGTAWRLVNSLNAIEWTLESAVAQLEGNLYQHIAPEAFGRSWPHVEKPTNRIAAVAA